MLIQSNPRSSLLVVAKSESFLGSLLHHTDAIVVLPLLLG